MKLAIMQPYFFPYPGYFQLIHSVDKFILYDHLSYIKHGWIHRNRIRTANGEAMFMEIPLAKKSSNRLIHELEIKDETEVWRKVEKTLFVNYRKTAYYKEVYPYVESLLSKKYIYLSQFNYESILCIVQLLELPVEIICNYCHSERIESKLLSDSYPYEKKTARIFQIAKNEGAATYINSPGGKELYDKSLFAENGLELLFIQSKPLTYEQRGEGFISDLSILDVLFNCGIKRTKEIIAEYTLV